MYAVWLRSAIADDVISQFPARRFDHLVDFALRHAKPFSDDLEVIDERLHLRLHLLAFRQHHLRRIGRVRAFRHAFEGLLDDPGTLAHFFHANLIARGHVALGLCWDFEVELVIARIWLLLACINGQSGGAQHRTGHSKVEHVVERHIADALRAAHPDRIASEEILILVDAAGKDVDEFPNSLPPAARRRKSQPADAKVTGHHALAGEHLENAQDLFALAEAVQKHAHRSYIDGMGPEPHKVAVEPCELGEHHAHPLSLGWNLELQQLFDRQAIAEIIGKWRQIIDAVGEGDA